MRRLAALLVLLAAGWAVPDAAAAGLRAGVCKADSGAGAGRAEVRACANFKTFNTAAPSPSTATHPLSFYQLLDPKPADPQLYGFLVRRIAEAVRRADADLGRAAAGWGSAELHGLTMNRSIEARLANHGMALERGHGTAEQDPAGVAHTLDPRVNVLRVDKVVRGRRVPICGWSTFADHGTVTKLWKVDDQGEYRASWEIPRHLRAARYRLVVSANRYRLASRPFRVVPSRALTVRRVEGGVTLDYPPAVRDQDLRHRPASASGGTVRYRRGRRTVVVERRRGTIFPVPEGATGVRGRDRFGNRALPSSSP